MIDNKTDYSRQKDLFDPINQRFRIIVLGAGSLGSFITLNLAKLGFDNISVYDYDIVEKQNIPNQFYRVDDIGKYKVDALKEIVKSFSNIEIIAYNEKITAESQFDMALNTIFVLTFDTLEMRKLVFNLLKDIKCDVLDVRAGGEEYNIQVINTFNTVDLDNWKKSFDIIPTELPCGAKSVIYTNLSVASEVCNIIKKMNNAEEYPKKLIRHMKKYLILNNLNKI